MPSYLYHDHRVNLLLSKGYRPEIPGDRKGRHRASGCCSCCCAPGQRGSECRCFVCCCSGSEQGVELFGRRGCPKAVGGITMKHVNDSAYSRFTQKTREFPQMSYSTISICDSYYNKDTNLKFCMLPLLNKTFLSYTKVFRVQSIRQLSN